MRRRPSPLHWVIIIAVATVWAWILLPSSVSKRLEQWLKPKPTAEEAAVKTITEKFNGNVSYPRPGDSEGVRVHLRPTGDHENLDFLADVSGVTSLNLRGVNVWDTDLNAVGKLSDLTDLYLDDNQIWGRGLKDLHSLKRLRWLSLSRNPIKDEYLKDVGEHTGLTWLYLSETRITDAGLKTWRV